MSTVLSVPERKNPAANAQQQGFIAGVLATFFNVGLQAATNLPTYKLLSFSSQVIGEEEIFPSLYEKLSLLSS
jgi:hypothetical protein